MATKIRLMRLGKKKAPQYRIVVVDSRVRRDGRVIETIGKYHPKEDPSFMQVDAERAGYWLSVGAQPSETVRSILQVTGDWQRFRGEPAPEPMRTRASRPDKKVVFDAAAKEAAGQPEAEATTPKRRAAKKASAQTSQSAPAKGGEPARAETGEPASETGQEPAAESSEPAGTDES